MGFDFIKSPDGDTADIEGYSIFFALPNKANRSQLRFESFIFHAYDRHFSIG